MEITVAMGQLSLPLPVILDAHAHTHTQQGQLDQPATFPHTHVAQTPGCLRTEQEIREVCRRAKVV